MLTPNESVLDVYRLIQRLSVPGTQIRVRMFTENDLIQET